MAKLDASRRHATWAFVTVLLLAPAAWGSPVSSGGTGRGDETVVVRGVLLPELHGQPVSEIAVYRYDAGSGAFVPIPYQIDQRIAKVFEAGTPGEFAEVMYDVLGEDDGILDADDEIAFLFGDAGSIAPESALWPLDAEPLRFEIAVQDPRPIGAEPTRWAYVFFGPDVPRSPSGYVSWDGGVFSDVVTDAFRLGYDGRWLVTGLRVAVPCGGGFDLIDRWKGRAEAVGQSRQDEEDWNGNSTYLGGLTGPIRAIRYVRGARSGVNTIHHDIVSRKRWIRNINLRVHSLSSVWTYFDWLPASGATLFTSANPSGISVDGVPDPAVGTTFTDWNLMKTPGGGALVVYDVPSSPLYAQKQFHYRDDASFNDIVPGKTAYPDDDNSAFGNHGFRIFDTLDSNVDPIVFRFHLFPLCANEGDATLATAYRERLTYPLAPVPVPQAHCDAVRSLTSRVEGTDVVLSWPPDADAEAFRVYAADFPDLPRPSWSLLSEAPATEYRDVGGASGGGARYYSVVCLKGGVPGPW